MLDESVFWFLGALGLLHVSAHVDTFNDQRYLEEEHFQYSEPFCSSESASESCPKEMASHMKAMRVHEFGDPEKIQLDVNIPIPIPRPGMVVVRVHASGINPVDTYIRAGTYKALPQLPYSPGKDVAGVIYAVGEGVHNVKVGERVFGPGGCAQYVECPSTAVHSLPDHLSFSQGASIGVPYFTAYKAAILMGDVKTGERVLVHGASGGVGLAAVQIASHMGAEVYGTAGTVEGAKVVESSGAKHVENHRESGYETKLLQATGGKGFDVILEMLANVNLAKDLDLVASRGKIIIIGNRGEITVNPRTIMQKECIVTGFLMAQSTSEEWKAVIKGVSEGLKDGWLVPQVSKEYKMEDLGQAHVDVMGSSGAKGNLVVLVQ